MKSHLAIEADNRTNFRSCLNALARPGRPQQLIPLFDSGLLAMASVLLYAEVSYWYRGPLDFQLIQAICGSWFASAGEADYLFLETPDPDPVRQAKTGSPESPEFSATIICQTESSGPPPLRVSLSGPGVDGTDRISLPVSPVFLETVQHQNSSYPMGVDLFLLDPELRLVGLPRTTTIEVL